MIKFVSRGDYFEQDSIDMWEHLKMVAGKKAKEQFRRQTEFLIIFYQKIGSTV